MRPLRERKVGAVKTPWEFSFEESSPDIDRNRERRQKWTREMKKEIRCVEITIANPDGAVLNKFVVKRRSDSMEVLSTEVEEFLSEKFEIKADEIFVQKVK